MKSYIRDKRSPISTSLKASKVMSAIKAKNTKPEMIFRAQLREQGLAGYRLHWKVAGRPDIAYPGRKLAIFINGCYWHRCPICDLPSPQSNTSFWENKFLKNVERDRQNITLLESAGWTVFVFWECQIKKDVPSLVKQIKDYLKKI